MKLLVVDDCDNSVREKGWRSPKRGTQVARARQGDVAGVTHARQRQSFAVAALCVYAREPCLNYSHVWLVMNG